MQLLRLLSLPALLRVAPALESIVQAHRPAASTWRRTQCGHPNGTADLPTRWGRTVTAAPPPDAAYPRPRMARGAGPSLAELRDRGDKSSWLSLNGLWEWEAVPCDVERKPCPGMNPPLLCCPEGNSSTVPPFGRTLQKSILVPFPQESCLSGVAPRRSDDIAMRSWYRLTFNKGGGKQQKKTLLHFGAVDWQAKVYVNRQLVATHSGGYDGFSADITTALALNTDDAAPHELLVHVFDPSETGPQLGGKQRMGVLSNPGELWTIVYTSTTGIWQTVWMETVPEEHIEDVQVEQASLDTVTVTVAVQQPPSSKSQHLQTATINVTVLDNGTEVVQACGAPGTPMRLKLPLPPILWDPDAAVPHLYDLRVQLSSGDEVTSYFGLRTWTLSHGFGAAPEGPLLEGEASPPPLDVALQLDPFFAANCSPSISGPLPFLVCLTCTFTTGATGTDLGGEDMNASKVADRATCKAQCQARQGCLAYVYTNCSGAQNCWLKKKPNEICTAEMRAAHGTGFSIACAQVDEPAPAGCAHWSQTVGYKAAPQPRFNGKPWFFAGALDQSWWPDGQYAAPTDEALESDILAVKAMGFNMLRLHQKVNPER
eukprot:SAG22_NODE_378_length_11517_cov_26.335523_5_plen_599_part_00